MKLLDSSGISTLWNKIKSKFSTKDEACGDIQITQNADTVGALFDLRSVSGSSLNEITLFPATSNSDGLMLHQHYDKVNKLKFEQSNIAGVIQYSSGNIVSVTLQKVMQLDSSNNLMYIKVEANNPNLKFVLTSGGTRIAYFPPITTDSNGHFTSGITLVLGNELDTLQESMEIEEI